MAVNLEGNIIINGKVGEGLENLLDTMKNFADTVDTIGKPIREWEKESVKTYKDYETNMLKARAALSDQYSSYNELNNVMETLEKQVQEWAANSVYHVSDFSEAVNNASHAGWNLEQQLQGIPRAMLLAQAGNMELADGLSYLARALNVTGTDFEDSGVLVDQWVKASHLANLTIEDLGDSIERMGITAQFTNNTAELFTMLDTLADTGVVGAQAGTLLRGTMLRLIAPTKKAREEMEKLEVTQEEINDLAGDSDALQKANKQLEKVGFSAYDTAGQLKPMMQIYDDLYNALVDIAGSEEDLLKNQTVDEILSALFPTRTISGALAFLKGVKGGWDDLYNDILDSEGAASKDAQTVMSGLMGAQELFLSKWEEFSRKVGEELSGPLETIYKSVGGLIDKLNGLPEEQLSSLVGGLTTIALMGPALGAGHGVIKFFTALGGWGTAAFFAAAGVGALVGYLNKISEIDFASQFGGLDLDVEALTSYVEGLESKYKAEQEAVGVWKEAVDAALTDYTDLTSKLNESLLEDVLTGKQLNTREIDNLKGYGEGIAKSVIEGIEGAQERDTHLLDFLFDDMSDDDQKEALDIGFALDNAYYESVLGQAKAIGEELRSQMVAALQDGTINAEERQAIMATEQRLNKIMQEINAYKDAEALNEQLYNAQHVSADSAKDYLENLVALDKEANETIEKNRAAAWASYKTKYDWAYENDTDLTLADGTTKKAREVDFDKFMNSMMARYDEEQAQIHGQYANLADVMFQTLFQDSKFAGSYDWMSKQVDAGNVTDTGSGYRFSGETYEDLAGKTDDELKAMRDGMSRMVDSAAAFSTILQQFGDTPEVRRMMDILNSPADLVNLIDNELVSREAKKSAGEAVDEYGRDATENIGDLTDEHLLRKILADNDLAVANGGYDLYSKEAEAYHQARQRMEELGYEYSGITTDGWYQDYLSEHQNESKERRKDYLTDKLDSAVEWLNTLTSKKAATESEIETRENRIQEKGEWKDWWYNFTNGPSSDYAALHGGSAQPGGGLYGQKEQLTVEIGNAQNNIENIQDDLDALESPDVKVGVELEEPENIQGQLDALEGRLHLPIADGGTMQQQLEEQGVTVEVAGDTQMLDATIAAEDGQILMAYVNGNTDDLSAAIYAEDGKTLIANVDGNVDDVVSKLNSLNGRTVHVNILGTKMFGYAEGGRATEPSIFGEVPGQAEWAIPEAHTERTLQLLNKAREASGFTWGDILGRFGGLNSDPNNVNVNLTYAPTINAGNAEGVSDVLENDKNRVERIVREAVKRAMSESKLHEDLEVYA